MIPVVLVLRYDWWFVKSIPIFKWQSIQTECEQNIIPTIGFFGKKYLETVNFSSPPVKGKHHAHSPVKPERQM